MKFLLFCIISFALAKNCIEPGDNGADYDGYRNVTTNGYNCENWGTYSWHHNYCRNPDNDPKGPWCYTKSSKSSFDYCHIPTCEDCMVDGEDYTGKTSTTARGYTCQRWDDNYPHLINRRLQRQLIDHHHNYCRNYGNSGEPWCFTTDRYVRFDRCYIPKCTVPTTTTTTSTTTKTTTSDPIFQWLLNRAANPIEVDTINIETGAPGDIRTTRMPTTFIATTWETTTFLTTMSATLTQSTLTSTTTSTTSSKTTTTSTTRTTITYTKNTTTTTIKTSKTIPITKDP